MQFQLRFDLILLLIDQLKWMKSAFSVKTNPVMHQWEILEGLLHILSQDDQLDAK